MRFLIVLSIVLAFSTLDSTHAIAAAEPIPLQVAKWLVVSTPVPESPAWYAANYSHYSWLVAIENEQVVARDTGSAARNLAKLPFHLTDKMMRGALCFTRVEDGWLIGRNEGEWGGDLWWYSPDGKKRYKISNDQVIGFAKTPTGLFTFEGLAHLSLDYGHVLRLSQTNQGRWRVQRYVDLGHAPAIAMAEKDGSLLVATTDTLVRIHPNKQIETLVKNTFWGGLYPVSIVETASGVIYLGMRHGIARILPQHNQYKVEWLLPNQDFVNAKPDLP